MYAIIASIGIVYLLGIPIVAAVLKMKNLDRDVGKDFHFTASLLWFIFVPAILLAAVVCVLGVPFANVHEKFSDRWKNKFLDMSTSSIPMYSIVILALLVSSFLISYKL